MLFCTSFRILVLKIPVNVSFYRLNTSGFNTDHHLMRKFLSQSQEKRRLKRFNNSMVSQLIDSYKSIDFVIFLICRDRNKENFAHRSFLSLTNYVENAASCSNHDT